MLVAAVVVVELEIRDNSNDTEQEQLFRLLPEDPRATDWHKYVQRRPTATAPATPSDTPIARRCHFRPNTVLHQLHLRYTKRPHLYVIEISHVLLADSL